MIKCYSYKSVLNNIRKYKNSKKKKSYKKQEYEEYTEITGEEWRELNAYPNIKVSNLGRVIKKGNNFILKSIKEVLEK